VLLTVVVGQQLIRHPHQPQAAHQHQARNLEQPDHAQRHQRAHPDGAHGAPDDGFALEMLRQITRRQRDHNGVVARQHQVDQDDGQQGRPPGGR